VREAGEGQSEGQGWYTHSLSYLNHVVDMAADEEARRATHHENLGASAIL
jgi:hypothetical protein